MSMNDLFGVTVNDEGKKICINVRDRVPALKFSIFSPFMNLFLSLRVITGSHQTLYHFPAGLLLSGGNQWNKVRLFYKISITLLWIHSSQSRTVKISYWHGHFGLPDFTNCTKSFTLTHCLHIISPCMVFNSCMKESNSRPLYKLTF